MSTRAIARQKRVRFRSRSSAVTILCPALALLFLAPGIALIAVGIADGRGQGAGGPEVIGLGTFMCLAAIPLISSVLRPLVVLTTHTLRCSRPRQRARITPLDQVTGIGLVYMRFTNEPVPLGWFLYLWTTGDVPRDLGISYQPASWLFPPDKVRQKFLAVPPSAADQGRSVDSYHFSYHFDPVAQTDPYKLAATYAGRVACALYEHVLAYQGPSGLLTTRADQKHVPVIAARPGTVRLGYRLQTAYWSPDGELGHADPEFAHQTRAPQIAAATQMGRPGARLRLGYVARRAGQRFRRPGIGDRGILR